MLAMAMSLAFLPRGAHVSTAAGSKCSTGRAQEVARVLAAIARRRLAFSTFCKCAPKTRGQLVQQYRMYNRDWHFELIDLRAPMRFDMDPVNGLGVMASSAAIAVNPNMATSTILYLELENARAGRPQYEGWILPGDPFGLSRERCS